jgi:OOP family OmpA-OmpF porin
MSLRNILMASAMMALPMAAASAQAVDGLYVGAGAGINYLQRENFKFSPGTTQGSARSNIGPAIVLSLGWGFGNGLRAEGEFSYRNNTGFNNPQFGFPASFGGTEQKVGGMANVLYDFVGVPVVQPYVGLGVGYQYVIEQNLHGAALGGTAFNSVNSGRGSFAYQAIRGAAYPIAAAPGLALTAEYRFMGLVGNRSYSVVGGGSITSTSDYNHSLLFGVRYAFNAAPAAAAPMPMMDNGAKTFLVFFDWNKSDLTGRSEGIVRDAAAYSTKTQYTRIDVDGNADTSGTPNYNQGLSERRARVVAAELVRDGVPQNAISMHAYGDTKLLVPTGPGVREPQNRRVEIVFH